MIENMAWTPDGSPDAPAPGDAVVICDERQILPASGGWLHDWDEQLPTIRGGGEPIPLGHLHGRRVHALPVVPGDATVSLREALLGAEPLMAQVLGSACQIVRWREDHRFCGRCGTATVAHHRERARWCESCGIPFYPRLAPCVITLITHGDRLFLARSSRHTHGFFSLIAGFIEPGESAEQAVAREVAEETGFRVRNIRYYQSQPWPFPHNLMLGFFAEYAGGEMVLQQDELAEAGWFEPGDLPPVPPKATIAGRLIEAALAERGSEK